MLHTVSAIARICAFAGMVCSAFCQIPSVIQIDIENYAYYYADNPDYSKLAGSQQAVPAVSTKTFSSFIGLADIVRVNGKPAKGTWSIRATTTNYTPAPQTGNRRHDPQFFRGLGMGDPASGWDPNRHDHGDRHGIWPAPARFTGRIVPDRREFNGHHGRYWRLLGHARSGWILGNHSDRARGISG